MLDRLHFFLVLLIIVIPGCVAPGPAKESSPATVEENDQDEEIKIPERLNIVADTAGRDVDRSQRMDVLADANGENTMILWVSTGCSGCHDWTEMIAEEMRNGNISNHTRIITIHRYPSFESRQEVINVYATNNSSTESLWPVLLPVKGQPAIDVENNNSTEFDYSVAFETPATPSFTILDGEGYTIWKNKEYWFDKSVLEEALGYL